MATIQKVKRRSDYDELSKQLSDGSVIYSDKDFLPQTIQTLNRYKIKAVY